MNSDYFATPFREYLFCRRPAFTCVFFYEKHISYQVAATECLDVLFEGRKNLPCDFAENSFAFVSGDPLSTF
jgi:hypothetical protein